ncbi:MAG: metal-dependent transcriptional regulator [Acidobacteriota bacterium]
MKTREIEEILEALWVCREKNNHHLEALKECCDIPVEPRFLSKLQKDGLITCDGEMVVLTKAGKDRAEQVIRRKRLAERLLVDVLNMSLRQAEEEACEFEHILAPQVTESICTLLGHPRECPHGRLIPEGECCREARNVVDNVVIPLTQLETGETAKVAYISTSSHPRLHKLTSFGLTPGATLKVHQKSPSYVISCAQTELALEKDVVRDIYVWRGQ